MRRLAVALLAAAATLAPAAPAVSSTAPQQQAVGVAAPRPPMVNDSPPVVAGVVRFGRTLTARPGRWSPRPTVLRYQWYVAGEPVRGARSRTYALRPGDVGRRVRVEVRAWAPGHLASTARSDARGPVLHRTDVRRTVTYHVETRGRITADLAVFRRQVQQTFADARGWRGAGVAFRPVRRGGRFTVVLAEASRVPAFSPVCSSEWSCRVGRYVIINQTRWKHASPAWNAADGSLRDYRHMVVDHETGHWLGHGHAGCGGRGQAAPVMMQQSKGLDGCRFNPWPTLGELRRTR